MRTSGLLLGFAAATVLLIGSADAAANPPARRSADAVCPDTALLPTQENLEQISAAVRCLHNRLRAQRGLPLLKDNAKLRKAALQHSAAMIRDGYFDHTAPDGDTFVVRILRTGYVRRYDGWTLGENLAKGTGELATPARVMQAWLNSPGHKGNVVGRAYRDIGIGIRLGVPGDPSAGATFTVEFGVKAA